MLIIFCFPFFPYSASSLCFAEKTIYTQEVLAVVLHQLMEMNPLPTLFMRTVISPLLLLEHLYPPQRLKGFFLFGESGAGFDFAPALTWHNGFL